MWSLKTTGYNQNWVRQISLWQCLGVLSLIFMFALIWSALSASAFEEANEINPTIQLTMSHTSPTTEAIEDQCDCEKKSEIPFLDTLVSFKNGFLDIDLYQKESVSPP